MPEIVLGLIALVALLFLGQAFIGANPRMLARGLRYLGAAILAAAAVGAFAFDRVGVGTLIASMAWGLFTGGHVLPAGLRGRHPSGAGDDGAAAGTQRQERPRGRAMSRAEALAILGLKEGATVEEIRAAHRKLILNNHPDRGGSDYLAAQINAAKDVLLG